MLVDLVIAGSKRQPRPGLTLPPSYWLLALAATVLAVHLLQIGALAVVLIGHRRAGNARQHGQRQEGGKGGSNDLHDRFSRGCCFYRDNPSGPRAVPRASHRCDDAHAKRATPKAWAEHLQSAWVAEILEVLVEYRPIRKPVALGAVAPVNRHIGPMSE